MKKLMTLALALILMLSLFATALAEADDQTFTVAGHSVVYLAADTASLEIGAMTRSSVAAEAHKTNEGIMQAVLQALKALGIDEKDMVTSNYSVYAEMPYMEPGSIRQPETTYNVTNMLCITIRDLDLVTPAIDAATRAGANQIYSLSFSSSKAAEGYQKAIDQAVTDGTMKAHALAAATGKSLGELLSADLMSTYGPFYGETNGAGMMLEEGDSSIVSGDVAVSADVSLVFRFK